MQLAVATCELHKCVCGYIHLIKAVAFTGCLHRQRHTHVYIFRWRFRSTCSCWMLPNKENLSLQRFPSLRLAALAVTAFAHSAQPLLLLECAVLTKQKCGHEVLSRLFDFAHFSASTFNL